MLRLNRRLAGAVGLGLALTLATPALAQAHGTIATTQHTAVPLGAVAFPSNASTVIGSVGFIDGTQCGYFWSVSRGDSVAQTFNGKPTIHKAIFKLDVPTNGLSGAEVDWTASINGTDIGSFVVQQGFTGPLKEKFHFSPMSGGSYAVKIRVTNEVPAGDGAITLTYAGADPHSLKLK